MKFTRKLRQENPKTYKKLIFLPQRRAPNRDPLREILKDNFQKLNPPTELSPNSRFPLIIQKKLRFDFLKDDRRIFRHLSLLTFAGLEYN